MAIFLDTSSFSFRDNRVSGTPTSECPMTITSSGSQYVRYALAGIASRCSDGTGSPSFDPPVWDLQTFDLIKQLVWPDHRSLFVYGLLNPNAVTSDLTVFPTAGENTDYAVGLISVGGVSSQYPWTDALSGSGNGEPMLTFPTMSTDAIFAFVSPNGLGGPDPAGTDHLGQAGGNIAILGEWAQADPVRTSIGRVGVNNEWAEIGVVMHPEGWQPPEKPAYKFRVA